MAEGFTFFRKYYQYKNYFDKSESVLEIGGGQCWASCVLKKNLPGKNITATDISPYAVKSAKHWEKVFDVILDKIFDCKSYEIPPGDATLDLVFCFASAHHFVKQKESLLEIYRVLRPDGVCLYLFEPACHKLFYKPAKKRVNKKRPVVPEDLLITKQMFQFATETGFTTTYVSHHPETANRGLFETFYYFLLSKFKFLQSLLPCTTDFVFVK